MSNQIISKNDVISKYDATGVSFNSDSNYIYSNLISGAHIIGIKNNSSSIDRNYFIANEIHSYYLISAMSFNSVCNTTSDFTAASGCKAIGTYSTSGTAPSSISCSSNNMAYLRKSISMPQTAIDVGLYNYCIFSGQYISGNISFRTGGSNVSTTGFSNDSKTWTRIEASSNSTAVDNVQISFKNSKDAVSTLRPSSATTDSGLYSWTNPQNAIDGNSGTYAHVSLGPEEMSEYLYADIPIKSGAFICSGVGYYLTREYSDIAWEKFEYQDLDNNWITLSNPSTWGSDGIEKTSNYPFIKKLRVMFENTHPWGDTWVRVHKLSVIGWYAGRIDDVDIYTIPTVSFIRNDVYDAGTNNWDNGTIGNYYSSSNNTSGNAGIGYKSSQIAGGSNYDKYPLVSGGIAGRTPVNFGLTIDNTFDSIENFNRNSFTTTTTNGTSPFTYTWDFGEGDTSTEANPIHYYLSANTHYVECYAHDSENYYSADVSHLETTDRGTVGFDAHGTIYKTINQGNLVVTFATTEWN